MELRILTPEDLDGAFALSSLMGWNQRLEDWSTLRDLAPAGTLVALDCQRVVGTAIGIDYGTAGWIAMMLVHPDYRGRGLGARLLEAALAAIAPGLPVGLDATPLGRPLYERHGFVLETSLTRHVRPANRGIVSNTTAEPVRPLQTKDLAAVARTDAVMIGSHRASLLQRTHAAAPEYAWHVEGGDAQYCLGRYGRLFDHIGPVAATSTGTAIALAGAALGNAGEKAAVVDAYDGNADFVAWLHSAGFESQRPLYRMWKPGSTAPRMRPPHAVTEFAILGPEFG